MRRHLLFVLRRRALLECVLPWANSELWEAGRATPVQPLRSLVGGPRLILANAFGNSTRLLLDNSTVLYFSVRFGKCWRRCAIMVYPSYSRTTNQKDRVSTSKRAGFGTSARRFCLVKITLGCGGNELVV